VLDVPAFERATSLSQALMVRLSGSSLRDPAGTPGALAPREDVMGVEAYSCGRSTLWFSKA
jgi:hypothetical protein